ncbi:glycosyltransferase [Mongoliitalea daihaiensis]|uniref:glycosyltransferase n=1 Tax=Mongoliitalea daihaiensis TaxID=2782006 RepID=UPI001F27EFAA|nr:glycosyltransferase [Mongoliitalea daihaiensis]UJP64520.1 glycosyltransferase [Mongoliitalea daihaiensis]
MITSILLLIVLVYTGIYFLLTLVFLIRKRRSINETFTEGKESISVAVVITAYREWRIAEPLIRSIQCQSYKDFKIYLVADNCSEPVSVQDQSNLIIIEPISPLHSKVKSIQEAVHNFKSNHDAVLILDPDNLLQEQCLGKLVEAYQQGFEVIQGQRVAKNLDTKIAALDALGEIYYNFNQRLIPFVAGSSATIAGSGMMIEYELFKDYLALFDQQSGVVLAEDKLLQMFVIERGKRIAYKEDALIFDEKSTTGAQVEKQRTRWLKSYFDHLGDVFSLLFKCLGNGNYQGAFFAFMISTPPFIFLVGLIFVSGASALIFTPESFSWVIIACCFFIFSWVFALLFNHAPALIWKSIPWIPVFALRQVFSLLGFKKAKKDFLATEHTKHFEIEAVWSARKKDFRHLNF